MKQGQDYECLNGNKMVEFHTLKLYPPSGLNRDEFGEQKSADFNGTLRNRISSQCIKRSIRCSELYKEEIGEIGIRTKKLPNEVYALLVEHGVNEQLAAIVKEQIDTDTLVFYSPEEFEEIKSFLLNKVLNLSDKEKEEICEKYEAAKKEKNGKKDGKKAKEKDKWMEGLNCVKPLTEDIILFGRMMTDNSLKQIDSCTAFAHVLSTTPANKETDYFIACDDLKLANEEIGAGMLGDIDFASGTYYGYARIDLREFARGVEGLENGDERVRCLPASFAALLSYVDPSARQHSFATGSLPEVLYIEFKERNINHHMATAFAEPCKNLKDSMEKFAHYINISNEKYDDIGIKHALWFCSDDSITPPEGVTVAKSMSEVRKYLNTWMGLDQ